jgi:hypothetical protein
LQSNTAMGLEPFKMKMTPSFTMSGTTYWVTQCHIPEDWNPQSDHCENIKTCLFMVAVL